MNENQNFALRKPKLCDFLNQKTENLDLNDHKSKS